MNRLSRIARAGFSLIEVNMAIFVLAGGALALLGLFPLGLRDSAEARNEMRVAAFADRFVGACRIAAEQAADKGEFEDLLAEAMDVSGGLKLNDSAGDADDDGSDYDEDKSGVYYRAWMTEEGLGSGELSSEHLKRYRLGLLVTAENPKQNPRAMYYAAGYGLTVTLDGRNAD